MHFAGHFTSKASSLQFDLERCDPQYDIDVPNLSYTATANGMVTFVTLADGPTVATTYLQQ